MLDKIIRSASLWSIIGVGLRVGGGLITLPLALRMLPKEEMGLYYTYISIAAIGLLFDFGFGPTISRNAAYANAGAVEFKATGIPNFQKGGAPNLPLLYKLKDAVRTWYVLVGIVLVLMLHIGGTCFVFVQINENHLPTHISGSWILFATATVLGFVSSYWQNLLVGIGKVLANAKILVVSQTLSMATLILCLCTGFGLWAYAIATFIAAIANRYLVKKIFCKETGLDSNSSFKLIFDKEILAALWPMAWRQGIVLLGAFLITKMNTLVCTNSLGLSSTADYGLSVSILAMIFQISAIPLSMAWPEISRLRVARDLLSIRKIFLSRTYIGLFAGMVMMVGLVFCGNELLAVVGSETRLLETSSFVILGVVYLLETHHSIYATLVLSENKNPFLIPAIVSGGAIFIASCWAAPRYGVIGIILSQGIVQLLWNNWWTVMIGLRGIKNETV